jgi:hypothetical protein
MFARNAQRSLALLNHRGLASVAACGSAATFSTAASPDRMVRNVAIIGIVLCPVELTLKRMINNNLILTSG